MTDPATGRSVVLEFTPLEFETFNYRSATIWKNLLEFTPLEFETEA